MISNTTWLVENYCNVCEDGKVYNDMVTSIGHYCGECDGTGTIEKTVLFYETECEVKEDYPEAIKVIKIHSARPLF